MVPGYLLCVTYEVLVHKDMLPRLDVCYVSNCVTPITC